MRVQGDAVGVVLQDHLVKKHPILQGTESIFLGDLGFERGGKRAQVWLRCSLTGSDARRSLHSGVWQPQDCLLVR